MDEIIVMRSNFYMDEFKSSNFIVFFSNYVLTTLNIFSESIFVMLLAMRIQSI